jgi:hypothetical protein
MMRRVGEEPHTLGGKVDLSVNCTRKDIRIVRHLYHIKLHVEEGFRGGQRQCGAITSLRPTRISLYLFLMYLVSNVIGN